MKYKQEYLKLLEENKKYEEALKSIVNYGKDNINYIFVQAFHTELIKIAKKALEK
jgi:hypothetical protein